MLKLFQFPPNPETHNLSPFCLKLETYLRLAGIPFESKAEGNPMKGPKGKLPFVEIDGERIGDSAFIIEHLKAKYGDKLDGKLSTERQALHTAITRLFESDLYFVLLYYRWVDADGWRFTTQRQFKRMPLPVRLFALPMIHKKVRRVAQSQGIGRHRPEEILKIGAADVDAISEFLSDQDFFLGSKPTSLDATAYGFLKNMIDDPLDTPLNRYARSKRNLVGYVSRMDRLVFAEGRVETTRGKSGEPAPKKRRTKAR